MARKRLNTLSAPPRLGINRRALLVAGGVGAGLVVAWTFWPRDFEHTLVANAGEHVMNAFVKVSEDGRISVAVPQIEMGQGAYTLIAQIIADELGADWRTIGIEPAPLNPMYGNEILAKEWNAGLASRLLGDYGRWVEEKLGPDDGFQATGGSSTIRAFESHARQAGAAARALLCQAAAARWDADWLACDTMDGFVVRGNDRARFGELAAEAATFEIPEQLTFRIGIENRLRGQSLPRLDYPAKIDGSANFAADIRFPGMVFASIRMGPLGAIRINAADTKALASSPRVAGVVLRDHWVAVAAQNWWAADQALAKHPPQFAIGGSPPDSKTARQRIKKAFETDPTMWFEQGNAAGVFAARPPLSAEYSVDLAPHAALEPMAATAIVRNDLLEIWLPTQVPGLARQAAADALGWSNDHVIIHPMLVGGSFGRKYEVEIAAQVAIIASELGKPVQLMWSREQDMAQDRFRPMAAARMTGRVDGATLSAWQARVTAPATMNEMLGRIRGGKAPQDALSEKFERAAMSGAVPAYKIPNVSIGHHMVNLGIPTGKWRSGADSYTAFFNESFVDELAKQAGIDPFVFRMGLMSGQKRLANCLRRVTALGNWQGGGAGTQQGVACHSMLGSHVAVLAEARIDDNQRIRVTKLYAVADVGRVTNGEIARQQIEGGLLFGMAAAIGNAVDVGGGIVSPRSLGGLGLPRLGDMPEMFVELVPSSEAFGGVGEVAVPPVAPAIANAIHAGGGRRLRTLPLLPWNT